jgi:hypothetical protein
MKIVKPVYAGFLSLNLIQLVYLTIVAIAPFVAATTQLNA